MKQVLMAVAVVVCGVGYQARAEETGSQGAVASQAAQVSLVQQAPRAQGTSQSAPASKPAPTKTGNFWTGGAKLVVVDHYSGAAAVPKRQGMPEVKPVEHRAWASWSRSRWKGSSASGSGFTPPPS